MMVTDNNNNNNMQQKQRKRTKKFKQYFNILIHKEPYESIVYGIFWFFFMLIVIPILAVVVVVPLTIYKIIDWLLDYNLNVNIGYYDPQNFVSNINENKKQMAIFINGCDINIYDDESEEESDSSSYCQNIVLCAANAGFIVFAACSNEKSVKYYNDINKKNNNIKESPPKHQQQQGKIIPILVDITNDDSVKKAAAQVSAWINTEENADDDGSTKQQHQQQRVLHALINNCGQSNIPGYFDWLDIDDCQKSFDINYFGMMRCCKALIPILKKQRYGRIINITSIAALLPGSSFFWNFATTQSACQIFSNGIRKELSTSIFNIDVTTIIPSYKQIQIINSIERTINNMWDNRMDTKQKDQFGEERVKSALRSDAMKITSGFPMKHVQPNKELDQIVVDKVLEILQLRGRGGGGNEEGSGADGGSGSSSSSLPAQVIVGADAKFYWILMRMLPGWFLSLEPPPAMDYGPKKKIKKM